MQTPRHGRRPDKRDQVVEHLRRLIVSGQLPPGTQLPTHKVLEARLDAESPTVRAAMAILGAEGVIETRHRQGTFVAAHPPHLSQFAVVFPFPSWQTDSQFYRAIRAEADRRQEPARRVLSFFEIHGHTDVADYQRLLELVESSCLAGVIFAANPFALRKIRSPLTELPGLPRVVIAAAPDEGGFPAVYPDLAGFLPQAFDHLAARGCRRVGIISVPSSHVLGQLRHLSELAAARGLTLAPEWLQAAMPASGPWIQQLVRLLMRGAPAARPDGLVITDDNLVPELTAGLAALGVRVAAAGDARTPGDLVVVALANFPHPTPSAAPVTRLGYDVTRLVAICLQRLDQQRRGETPPLMTWLPARFADATAAVPTRLTARSRSTRRGAPADPNATLTARPG